MKVSFVTTDITQPAGTERVIVNLSNYFVSRGIAVDMHSLSTTAGNAFYELDSRVAVFHHGLADYSTESSRWVIIARKIRNTLRVRSCLKQIEGDFIIGTGKHINTYLTFFKRSGKQRIIGCEHFAYNAPMSFFTKIVRNYAYRRLDHLVVLTEKDRTYYSSFVKTVHCIPNSCSFYPETPSSLEQKVVLAIGRHTPQKGFDLLLPVWKEIVGILPDWQLQIVGTGPLLEERQRQAEALELQQHVQFAPPSKDILNKYLNAAAYVMPSRYEAFPMVLLEAMACGLPCVAYNCDTGPGEIITDEEDGFIVPLYDAAGFKSRLVELMENEDRRKEMGSMARKNVQRYDIAKIGYLWEQLFEESLRS